MLPRGIFPNLRQPRLFPGCLRQASVTPEISCGQRFRRRHRARNFAVPKTRMSLSPEGIPDPFLAASTRVSGAARPSTPSGGSSATGGLAARKMRFGWNYAVVVELTHRYASSRCPGASRCLSYAAATFVACFGDETCISELRHLYQLVSLEEHH